MAGVTAGGLCGALNGWLVTRLSIVPFIVTLGMMGVARGVAKWLSAEQTVTPSPEASDALAAREAASARATVAERAAEEARARAQAAEAEQASAVQSANAEKLAAIEAANAEAAEAEMNAAKAIRDRDAASARAAALAGMSEAS